MLVLLQVDGAVRPAPPGASAPAAAGSVRRWSPRRGFCLAYDHACPRVAAVARVDLGGKEGIAYHRDAQIHTLYAALEITGASRTSSSRARSSASTRRVPRQSAMLARKG